MSLEPLVVRFSIDHVPRGPCRSETHRRSRRRQGICLRTQYSVAAVYAGMGDNTFVDDQDCERPGGWIIKSFGN